MIELDVETQKHILIRNKTSLKTTALSCTKINTKSTLLHKKCFSVLYWRKKIFPEIFKILKKIYFWVMGTDHTIQTQIWLLYLYIFPPSFSIFFFCWLPLPVIWKKRFVKRNPVELSKFFTGQETQDCLVMNL